MTFMFQHLSSHQVYDENDMVSPSPLQPSPPPSSTTATKKRQSVYIPIQNEIRTLIQMKEGESEREGWSKSRQV